MSLKITYSKNISSLPTFDYKEEAVSDHGRVKAIFLGRNVSIRLSAIDVENESNVSIRTLDRNNKYSKCRL